MKKTTFKDLDQPDWLRPQDLTFYSPENAQVLFAESKMLREIFDSLPALNPDEDYNAFVRGFYSQDVEICWAIGRMVVPEGEHEYERNGFIFQLTGVTPERRKEASEYMIRMLISMSNNGKVESISPGLSFGGISPN